MWNKIKKCKCFIIAIVIASLMAVTGCADDSQNSNVSNEIATTEQKSNIVDNEKTATSNYENADSKTKKGSNLSYDIKEFIEKNQYDKDAYIVIEDNTPFFTDEEITNKSYELYSDLDYLGRCGVAMACVGTDIMPTEERGAIGQVKPTGWHTVKYDCVDGKYLYNRCHLIGYQLTGENANEKNLITGTRYLNVDGMLPFENMVADYVKETKNHVMYRVTPLYYGNNLLASGVEMEAYSVEDDGDGICFHVYCYNVQPGVEIDYTNGESNLADSVNKSNTAINNKEETTKKSNSTKKNNTSIADNERQNTSTEYILNMNTHKFHYSTCYSVKNISNSNKGTYKGDRQDLINQGYEPCKNCNP